MLTNLLIRLYKFVYMKQVQTTWEVVRNKIQLVTNLIPSLKVLTTISMLFTCYSWHVYTTNGYMSWNCNLIKKGVQVLTEKTILNCCVCN